MDSVECAIRSLAPTSVRVEGYEEIPGRQSLILLGPKSGVQIHHKGEPAGFVAFMHAYFAAGRHKAMA